MTIQKRKLLQLVALSAAALGLAACGGGGNDNGAAGSAGTGGGNSGGGGGVGSLTLTGNSNLPVLAPLTPDAGAAKVSNAVLSNTLLVASASDLGSGLLRSLILTINPLGNGAVPAVGVTYAVQDPDKNGNYANANLVLPTFSGQAVTVGGAFYAFGAEKSSGTVKVTALSATSVELLLTNVSLTSVVDPKSSSTGTVVLNGSITLPLTGK